jgi:predicted RNA-binding Zn-ribbon protein involved in translation (DUF1610 family)
MKGIFNYIKIIVVANKLKENKKCPNCGFEGLMGCWKTMETNDTLSKCPNCKFTFSWCNITFIKNQK